MLSHSQPALQAVLQLTNGILLQWCKAPADSIQDLLAWGRSVVTDKAPFIKFHIREVLAGDCHVRL